MSDDERRACRNGLCDYSTSARAAYCCEGCARADQGHYEVDDSVPMLGHSASCRRVPVVGGEDSGDE